MEYTKSTTIYFFDTYAKVDMEYQNEDCILLTLTELIIDEEASTKGNEVLESGKKLEINLGENELKELIHSLEALLPKGDFNG